MIRRLLKGRCEQCGGSKLLSDGDINRMDANTCKSTLKMVVDKYQDCRVNISGSPILPPSIRGDQSCNSLCPISKESCMGRFPDVCKRG